MTTFGSLFSGGGGADIGALQAGLTPVWAVEYEPDIYVDILHASPPCPSFSVANSGRGETAADIAVAQATADIIRHVAPRAVTVEHVALYRHSESYRLILDTLHECGYWTAVDTVNFADYGVPQTRTRLIVRAVRGGWVPYLRPTHDKGGANGLPRWIGWYEAIADLLDTLPDSQFAPWQLKRLPDELAGAFLADGKLNANSTSLTQRDNSDPAMTVTTSHNQRDWKAAAGSRVVQMTPRALARFQTFPDWYELPDTKTLASRIIGNAVPPLGYQRIVETLV